MSRDEAIGDPDVVISVETCGAELQDVDGFVYSCERTDPHVSSLLDEDSWHQVHLWFYADDTRMRGVVAWSGTPEPDRRYD